MRELCNYTSLYTIYIFIGTLEIPFSSPVIIEILKKMRGIKQQIYNFQDCRFLSRRGFESILNHIISVSWKCNSQIQISSFSSGFQSFLGTFDIHSTRFCGSVLWAGNLKKCNSSVIPSLSLPYEV